MPWQQLLSTTLGSDHASGILAAMGQLPTSVNDRFGAVNRFDATKPDT